MLHQAHSASPAHGKHGPRGASVLELSFRACAQRAKAYICFPINLGYFYGMKQVSRNCMALFTRMPVRDEEGAIWPQPTARAVHISFLCSRPAAIFAASNKGPTPHRQIMVVPWSLAPTASSPLAPGTQRW